MMYHVQLLLIDIITLIGLFQISSHGTPCRDQWVFLMSTLAMGLPLATWLPLIWGIQKQWCRLVCMRIYLYVCALDCVYECLRACVHARAMCQSECCVVCPCVCTLYIYAAPCFMLGFYNLSLSYSHHRKH